jgi:hypothetical protein
MRGRLCDDFERLTTDMRRFMTWLLFENASLGDFVVVLTCTYTNLDSTKLNKLYTNLPPKTTILFKVVSIVATCFGSFSMSHPQAIYIPRTYKLMTCYYVR